LVHDFSEGGIPIIDEKASLEQIARKLDWKFYVAPAAVKRECKPNTFGIHLLKILNEVFEINSSVIPSFRVEIRRVKIDEISPGSGPRSVSVISLNKFDIFYPDGPRE